MPPGQSPGQPMAIKLGHLSCLFRPFSCLSALIYLGLAGQIARSRVSTEVPVAHRPDENLALRGTCARAQTQAVGAPQYSHSFCLRNPAESNGNHSKGDSMIGLKKLRLLGSGKLQIPAFFVPGMVRAFRKWFLSWLRKSPDFK